MTYFGTGCIFHYDDDFPMNSGKGFKESDKPNFTGSYYSYTKVQPSSCATCSREFPVCTVVSRHVYTQRTVACYLQRCSTFLSVLHVYSMHFAVSAVLLACQAMVESLLKEYPNVLTLRVRMPIVADLIYERNFITKIIRYEKVHSTHVFYMCQSACACVVAIVSSTLSAQCRLLELVHCTPNRLSLQRCARNTHLVSFTMVYAYGQEASVGCRAVWASQVMHLMSCLPCVHTAKPNACLNTAICAYGPCHAAGCEHPQLNDSAARADPLCN